jgi:hypothetical protein
VQRSAVAAGAAEYAAAYSPFIIVFILKIISLYYGTLAAIESLSWLCAGRLL